MVRLPLNCSDAEILAVAEEWTNRLAAEDYAGAWDMLLHRPGEVWAPTPDKIRDRIVNCGCEMPVEGEPPRVTPTATATGTPWRWLPSLTRTELPLNGEWSDLVASFDLEGHGGALVFVLAALRVP